MIETVASASMLIGEVMKVKKNRLAPDFPNGKEKRLSIVSGLHGDEVAGQYICYELIRRIKKDFDQLTGIVDVYPFINPMGLEAQNRDVPVFDIDMNTLFPGSTEGTVGEYTAALVVKDIIGSDICVDIHSSSVYLKELPQVRINSDIAADIEPYAARMNTDVIWVHPSSTVMVGSLAYALNEMGVKSMVVESGVALKIDYDYANQIVEGLFSLMEYMGIWKGAANNTHIPKIARDDDVAYINAESSGIFIPAVKHSGIIRKGDVIGHIVNVLTGSIEETITAPRSGMVFSLREYPVIEEGSLVARIFGGTNE
ncbi:MAG: M14 family metallopeptidase [Coprococcus sp.]